MTHRKINIPDTHCMVYLHLVDFYGKLVGKHTSPMDPMGKILQFDEHICSTVLSPPTRNSLKCKGNSFSRKKQPLYKVGPLPVISGVITL